MSMKEKNMNENIDFCEVCLDDKHYIVKEEEKIDYARGKEIKYIRKQAYCTECNSPMYIPQINELKGCESAVSLDISKIESVAEYLIIKCGEITPLALQKLLYYSQAFCKLFTDSYLFEEDCEAWVHGPVYRCIYENYRVFGRSVIDTDDNELLLDEIEDHVIHSVVRYFGCYSAKSLEEMTHCEKPWIITRKGLKKNEACNRIIEKELIDSYFIEIKNKYNIVNIDDIKQYSSSLFKNIY